MALTTLEDTITWDRDAWIQSAPSEVVFWDKWILNGGANWPKDYQRRTDPKAPLSPIVLELLAGLDFDPHKQLKVLDIGSGPLSYVGYDHETHGVDLTVVDPLANEYNSLLDSVNIKDVPRPQKGFFETALGDFGENQFDVVWCFNSLDHSIDPLYGLFNLLSVVNVGGGLILSFHPNEAEGGKYKGLHQWNLDIDSDGLLLSQKGKQTRINGLLAQQKVLKRHGSPEGAGASKGRITYLIKKIANVNLSQALLS
jgi:SAM-dependent methyltransferase